MAGYDVLGIALNISFWGKLIRKTATRYVPKPGIFGHQKKNATNMPTNRPAKTGFPGI